MDAADARDNARNPRYNFDDKTIIVVSPQEKHFSKKTPTFDSDEKLFQYFVALEYVQTSSGQYLDHKELKKRAQNVINGYHPINSLPRAKRIREIVAAHTLGKAQNPRYLLERMRNLVTSPTDHHDQIQSLEEDVKAILDVLMKTGKLPKGADAIKDIYPNVEEVIARFR